MPPLVRARAGSARQKRLNTMADSPTAEPDAVVADGDRGRLLVGRDGDHDLPALGVVDGVGDEVAHDPLEPAYVGLGDARLSGARTTTSVLRCSASDRVPSTTRRDDVGEVDVVEVERGRAGVEPADLEQVDQQRLEPVELGLEQLGGAPCRGSKSLARLVEHRPASRTVVSGVRSSWDTSETKRRWTRLSSSS